VKCFPRINPAANPMIVKTAMNGNIVVSFFCLLLSPKPWEEEDEEGK
jgi:hypothetical protein